MQNMEINAGVAGLPDDALLVDVRNESEYAGGHIPGSQNLPAFSTGISLYCLLHFRFGQQRLCHCGIRLRKVDLRHFFAYLLC